MLIKSLREINLDQSKFPLFFGDEWLNVQTLNDKRISTHIYYDESNQSLIPFQKVKLKFLKYIKYLYCPLNIDSKEFNSNEEKIILDNFHNYVSKLCDVILPPEHYVNFKCIPDEVYYYELGIISIDLKKDIQQINSEINSSFRSKIRQALKNDVNIQINPSNLNLFYQLYEQTHIRQEINPESLEFFESYVNNLPNNTLIGISKSGNDLESGIFCLKDNLNCYYEYGGSAEKTKFSGSNKLLFLILIEQLKSSGISTLILGGYRKNATEKSKNYGIQLFKLRLGGEVKEGFHFYKVTSPYKFYIFNLILKIKSLLKGFKYSLINFSNVEVKQSDDEAK
jgi:lipid II:glycine glycyltransferase (peptidoglycan interpeptide bridge formation enzyme)